MSLVPVIAPKTPYHPIKDFTHIACIAGAPVMLAVHPSTKVKTVAEFIEYGKTVGKPLTFASAGVGSDGHVMGEAIAAAIDGLPGRTDVPGTGSPVAGEFDVVCAHVIGCALVGDANARQASWLRFSFDNSGEGAQLAKLAGSSLDHLPRPARDAEAAQPLRAAARADDHGGIQPLRG